MTFDLCLGSKKLLRFQEVSIGREEEGFLPRGVTGGSSEKTAFSWNFCFSVLFCFALFLGFLLG